MHNHAADRERVPYASIVSARGKVAAKSDLSVDDDRRLQGEGCPSEPRIQRAVEAGKEGGKATRQKRRRPPRLDQPEDLGNERWPRRGRREAGEPPTVQGPQRPRTAEAG